MVYIKKPLLRLAILVLVLAISVIALNLIFFSKTTTLAQQCDSENCVFCYTENDCINAGCEWDAEFGICLYPPNGEPTPGPSEGECTEVSTPFTWGTINTDVSGDGNTLNVYNSSANAFEAERTIDGCPPPVFNEPPFHQPETAEPGENAVAYRIDAGGWIVLSYLADWWEGLVPPQCSAEESQCSYDCCQNTYDMGFTVDISGLSCGNHSITIRTRGAYPGGSWWEYQTSVPFTRCECSSADGPCCSDNCCFDSSSTSCDSGTEYQCSGTDCGADYQQRTWTQYCPGNAATCTGSINYGNWSTIADCTASERCYTTSPYCRVDICCTNNSPNVPTLTAPPTTWINYNPTFQATVSDPNGNNVRANFEITGFGSGLGDWVGSNNTSSWGLVTLSDGQYTWRARAEDNTGCFNKYGNWTSYRWLGVDKTEPNCDSMTYSPASPDTGDQVTFTVNASDATSGVASIEIFVDGGSVKTCSVSTICSYTGGPYSQGSHTYSANVTDNAGNTDSTPCSGTFNVGALGVNVALEANPYYGNPGFFSTLTATVGGTAEGAITYEFDCTSNGDIEHTITTDQNPYSYSSCAYNSDSLAKIKVTREGLTAEDTVNLYISTFAITPDPANIFVGGTQQFTAFYDPDGLNGPESSQNVTNSANWSSGNSSIASVNSTGLATGQSEGTTFITATYSGLSDSATINVGQRVSNYKVIISGLNIPPTATNLQRTDPDWCASPPAYSFSWTYSDPDNNPESRFDFQVDNNSNFSSPEIDRSYTGLSWPSGTQNAQAGLLAVSSLPDYLTYNSTTYYWRVRVWDSNGEDSGWVNNGSFTTQPHHWPAPDFTWQPESPIPEEETQFFDETTYYGGSVGAIWSWTFQDADPSSSGEENPLIIFQSPETKTVTLTVTDSDGYSCPVSRTVNVSLSLPKWKEIKPW